MLGISIHQIRHENGHRPTIRRLPESAIQTSAAAWRSGPKSLRTHLKPARTTLPWDPLTRHHRREIKRPWQSLNSLNTSTATNDRDLGFRLSAFWKLVRPSLSVGRSDYVDFHLIRIPTSRRSSLLNVAFAHGHGPVPLHNLIAGCGRREACTTVSA